MIDYHLQDETIHGSFDIEKHKKVFIEYLECVITEDGVIHYAVPSHGEFLIKLEMEKRSMTRDEFMELAIRNLWAPEDLALDMHAIMTWSGRIFGKPNEAQEKTLQFLRDHGVLHDHPSS